MANIMNPILPVAGVERAAPPAKAERPSGDKFSDHLDRKLQDQRSNNDKIGLKQREARHAASERTSRQKQLQDEVKPDADAPAAEILAFFMQDLQQVADDNGFGIGEWVTSIEDEGFLEGLAANAGMSDIDLIALTEKFQTEDGSLDLPSFFQMMQDHFEDFKMDTGVLVPETELPQLESLLGKMGLTQEQLASLSEQVVAGDGQIDLDALNKQLLALLGTDASLEQVQPITLSDTEVEQLQALLSKAGMNLGDQIDLLPEPLLGEDVVLSMERLQAMLDKAVQTAQDASPKVDLAAFLKDLESVMQDAKFIDQSAGIAPLVQNSLVDVYKNITKMFDEMQKRFDEGLALEEGASGEDIDKWRAGVADRLANLTGMDAADIKVQRVLATEGGQSSVSVTAATGGTSDQTVLMSGTHQPQSVEQSIAANTGNDQPLPTRHFTTQQQHQIFNQLSLAVARGMKSGEHHLTLRLHPVELGDVKVDLVMKGDEISAHFNIANSKVKETLETSLDEFRQEMEQKGFNLGALNVSVGGQDQPDETWQRFEMAWSGERLQAETLEDLPDTALYQRGMNQQYASQEQGVNLFV